MRISRTDTVDGRAIWACCCLSANIMLLPKGQGVQHSRKVLVAAECGIYSCLVPLMRNV